MKLLRREWISLDDKQRTTLSEETLQAFKIEESDEKEVLENFYKRRNCGKIPEESIADVWLALSHLRSGEIADKALLNLYYTFTDDIGISDNDEEESEIFLSVLRNLTDNPWESDDKYRIARLLWIKLRILVFIDEETEETRAYVESIFNHGNFDTYIWDRVFGALNDWTGKWRLYPQILSWEPSFEETPERYWPFVRDINSMYSESFKMISSLNSKLEMSLYSVAKGKIRISDLRSILQILSESEKEFPLNKSDVNRIYKNGSELIRALLWEMVFVFHEKKGLSQVKEYLTLLQGKALKESHPYFHFVSLYADLLTRFSELDLLDLWKKSILIARDFFNSINDRSEARYESGKIFEHIWLSIINSGVKINIINPVFGELLNDSSPFIQKAAASVILELSRKGVSMDTVYNSSLLFVEQNPSMNGFMSNGSDIKEEERMLPQGAPTPTYYFPPDVNEEINNDFFNVSSMTGLLESMQQPHTSYRLSLALKHYSSNFPEVEIPEDILTALKEYESMLDSKEN